MGLFKKVKNKVNKAISVLYTPQQIKAILDSETQEIFSQDGSWNSSCFNRPKNLSLAYLVCNDRDKKWLTELYADRLRRKGKELPEDEIKNYVENSIYLREQRHAFELRVVEWQIGWMRSGGENWLVPSGYGGDFWGMHPNIDKGFRKGVLKTLTAIGMKEEVIEEGLEKYSHLWRDHYINAAFANTYEPLIWVNGHLADLPKAESLHKELWIKLRIYEYYQDHKNSVDKYGIVTPNMTLTKEEVERLKTFLERKNEARKQQIKTVNTTGKGCFADYIDEREK